MNEATRLAALLHQVRMCYKPAEDLLLSMRDVGLRERNKFQRLRHTPDYRAAYRKEQPLVSILIATYNRARLLRERSLRSCLEQTYKNIEIIVVGDNCTDETEQVMADLTDSRARFVNLPERGKYPTDTRLRWMVAGTAPVNHALSLAQGDFITHLDDDDEHAPDRVQRLLEYIRETGSDLIYHPFRFETSTGDWNVNEAKTFKMGKVTTSSIFYHGYFTKLGWDPLAYRYREPGDWNRLRKIGFLGADVRRHPGVFLTHYRERNQPQTLSKQTIPMLGRIK